MPKPKSLGPWFFARWRLALTTALLLEHGAFKRGLTAS